MSLAYLLATVGLGLCQNTNFTSSSGKKNKPFLPLLHFLHSLCQSSSQFTLHQRCFPSGKIIRCWNRFSCWLRNNRHTSNLALRFGHIVITRIKILLLKRNHHFQNIEIPKLSNSLALFQQYNYSVTSISLVPQGKSKIVFLHGSTI